MTTMTQPKTQDISKRQVWEAWNHVKKGGKGMGVDNVSIAMIEADYPKYLYPLWNRLASGSYFPPPVKEVSIPKGDGKERKLGIPTILDRVAQQVIRGDLEPILEPQFHDSSFGYRPKRGAHNALEQCDRNCWDHWYAVDLDIKGFFDNIDHANMMKVLRRYTDKKHILLYCERWLKASVQKTDGTIQERLKGTPQGGVISPLLANLYLHEVFDKWMANRHPSIPFERYADDIVIHAKSRQQAEFLMREVEERLALASLELSKEKSKIAYCYRSSKFCIEDKNYLKSFDFLGFTFKPRRCQSREGDIFWGFRPAISNKKKTLIKKELSDLNFHQWTRKSIHEIANILAPKIRGWINYYGRFTKHAMAEVFTQLDTRLAKWAKNRYKLRTASRGFYWILREWKLNPKLFVHWAHGFSVGSSS